MLRLLGRMLANRRQSLLREMKSLPKGGSGIAARELSFL